MTHTFEKRFLCSLAIWILKPFVEENKTKISENRNRGGKTDLRGKRGDASIVGVFI